MDVNDLKLEVSIYSFEKLSANVKVMIEFSPEDVGDSMALIIFNTAHNNAKVLSDDRNSNIFRSKKKG
jgi:hypothetical protein